MLLWLHFYTQISNPSHQSGKGDLSNGILLCFIWVALILYYLIVSVHGLPHACVFQIDLWRSHCPMPTPTLMPLFVQSLSLYHSHGHTTLTWPLIQGHTTHTRSYQSCMVKPLIHGHSYKVIPLIYGETTHEYKVTPLIQGHTTHTGSHHSYKVIPLIHDHTTHGQTTNRWSNNSI